MSNQPGSGLPLKITIIGAGIAGLSTAIALSDINPNHQITILEANPALSEYGAGLQLFANSTRLLHKWGLTQSMEKVACSATHMSIRRWKDNIELVRNMNNPTSQWLYGWPQWQIYRPDLQRVLFERAQQMPNVSVLFGKLVKSIDHETGAVHTDTVNGDVFKGDLTIAADGIWSKSRRCLPMTKDVTPTPSKEHAYRAMIPRERMLSHPLTAPLISSSEAISWVGPGVFVLGYTVASGEFYNLAIIVPRPSKEMPIGSWNNPADVERMRKLTSDWCEEAQALMHHVRKEECVAWTLGEVASIPQYMSPSGRVVVVGDAAHAMLPHAAQGAGMAMEDSASLAEFVDSLRSREDLSKDLPNILSAWSQFRQARVEHLRSMSHGNASDMTLPDGEEQIMRDEKWNAILDVQRAQAEAAELGLEKIKEKVIRESPMPDPNSKSTVDPAGRMWISGYDVCQESRKFCRDHLELFETETARL
jgi:salicylate hydroxylase